MYHVIDRQTSKHVFLEEDPRDDGFDGEVHEDVRLETPPQTEGWSSGKVDVRQYLGRSPEDDRLYRVFVSTGDCETARFVPLGTDFAVARTWKQFEAQRHTKPADLR